MTSKNPRGAGRKPTIAKDGGKRINVYLDAESITLATKLGEGNVSLGIRKALHNNQEDKQMTNFEIIFDNGGSATLQINNTEYVHVYDDMQQLAADVIELVDGADASGWDGNEPECYIDENTYLDHAQNGGYCAIDQDTWMDDHTESGWRNVREFSEAVMNT